MPTIRDLVDGRDLQFASPMAKHIANNLQDPVGATKDDFEDLTNKRTAYDEAREKARRNLAPVQTVIDHVSMLHGLQPGAPMPGVNPTSGDEVDEYGNPMNMTQQSGGVMNVNRPSLQGHQPGVAPMMENQVVPPKLGMASPGGPAARNSPAPKGSNPQGMQYNRQAKPPKGNRSLPGAQGPGDPKVANRTKKAFGKSPGEKNSVSRPVKVTVHAYRDYPEVSNIDAERSLSDLKFHGSIKAASGSAPIGPGGALGPSGVMPAANPATGAPIPTPGGTVQGKSKKKKNKMTALDSLSDKLPADTEHQVAYNPKFEAAKTIDLCAKCGGMHVKGACPKSMKATGSKFGAKKGWSTRGHGHLSDTEKAAHYQTLKDQVDAREFSQKQRKSLAKKGEAMPHGGFPIANRQDLKNAKRAIGRAKNRAATIRHINKRAKALGAPGFGAKMMAAFRHAIIKGYKPRMEAKAPPGWEGTVKHMKKHAEITNPYALAWYMKDKGDTPHKAMAAFAA